MKLVKGRDLRAIFELVQSGATTWVQSQANADLAETNSALETARVEAETKEELALDNERAAGGGQSRRRRAPA